MYDAMSDAGSRLSAEEMSELAALADGTLPAERRPEVEARVAASAELAELLERQRQAVLAARSLADEAARRARRVGSPHRYSGEGRTRAGRAPYKGPSKSASVKAMVGPACRTVAPMRCSEMQPVAMSRDEPVLQSVLRAPIAAPQLRC